MTKNSEAHNLRKACLRRGLALRVLGGDIVTISEPMRLIWGPGAVGAARAWLDAKYPGVRGRPANPSVAPKPKRRRAPGAMLWPMLARDDQGLASPDYTPENARGLVPTEIVLPDWLGADAALIGLWRAEWLGPSSVLDGMIPAARRALRGPTVVRVIVCSDADRASLARYRGTPAEVLTAASLAPRRGKAGGPVA